MNKELQLTCDSCGGTGLIFLDPTTGSQSHRCCMDRKTAMNVATTIPLELRENFIEGWKDDMRTMHYKDKKLQGIVD